MPKIKVLLVDDSASVRQMLTEILNSDPEIEVVGAAADPYIAVRHIEKFHPDVIMLDVEMPRMDGITFLEKIMSQHPMPVVMCSSLTTAGSQTALAALEKGAIEVIEKPRVGTRQFLNDSRITICDIIKSAAAARMPGGPARTREERASRDKAESPDTRPPESGKPESSTKPARERSLSSPPPKLSPDVILPKPSTQSMVETTEKVVVVGASTGGTEALRIFLEQMPADCPGILVVQHMPEKFTTTFAKRLDSLCKITVKEAENGDTVLRGHALIAPGNRHMLLKRSGARYYVELHDGPMVSRHRPSVNVLFRSAARYGGKNIVGVIMTGMGDDGAMGMAEMREHGAINFAQDEASCIVFGMPAEAIKAGAVQKVLPLTQLAEAVVRQCEESR